MKTVATFIALATLMPAQTPDGAALPSFEVAAVKLSTTTGSFSVNFPPGGRFSGRNLTVWNLMRMAYHLQDYQIQARLRGQTRPATTLKRGRPRGRASRRGKRC